MMSNPRNIQPTMAPLHSAICVVALACVITACGTDEDSSTPPIATSDAGSSSDGTSGADGVSGADGASGADAGAQDGGATDAGVADGGAADAGAPAPRPFNKQKISIAGVWESSFGGNETISDDAWVTGFGTSKVVKFDSDTQTVFTQNAKDDKYNPSKFNKVQWTKPIKVDEDGFKVTSIYYCMVTFGKDSLALAEQATETADPTNPEKSGCGNFPWTKLSALETIGKWTTNFDTTEQINSQAWGYTWLRSFENGKNVAYTQNTKDAKYGPNTWNKVMWTKQDAGTWHFCTVDFGLKDLAAAQASEKTADTKDLSGKGCGGFPWTAMTAFKAN